VVGALHRAEQKALARLLAKLEEGLDGGDGGAS
jgi:hypothetical protein